MTMTTVDEPHDDDSSDDEDGAVPLQRDTTLPLVAQEAEPVDRVASPNATEGSRNTAFELPTELVWFQEDGVAIASAPPLSLATSSGDVSRLRAVVPKRRQQGRPAGHLTAKERFVLEVTRKLSARYIDEEDILRLLPSDLVRHVDIDIARRGGTFVSIITQEPVLGVRAMQAILREVESGSSAVIEDAWPVKRHQRPEAMLLESPRSFDLVGEELAPFEEGTDESTTGGATSKGGVVYRRRRLDGKLVAVPAVDNTFIAEGDEIVAAQPRAKAAAAKALAAATVGGVAVTDAADAAALAAGLDTDSDEDSDDSDLVSSMSEGSEIESREVFDLTVNFASGDDEGEGVLRTPQQAIKVVPPAALAGGDGSIRSGPTTPQASSAGAGAGEAPPSLKPLTKKQLLAQAAMDFVRTYARKDKVAIIAAVDRFASTSLEPCPDVLSDALRLEAQLLAMGFVVVVMRTDAEEEHLQPTATNIKRLLKGFLQVVPHAAADVCLFVLSRGFIGNRPGSDAMAQGDGGADGMDEQQQPSGTVDSQNDKSPEQHRSGRKRRKSTRSKSNAKSTGKASAAASPMQGSLSPVMPNSLAMPSNTTTNNNSNSTMLGTKTPTAASLMKSPTPSALRANASAADLRLSRGQSATSLRRSGSRTGSRAQLGASDGDAAGALEWHVVLGCDATEESCSVSSAGSLLPAALGVARSAFGRAPTIFVDAQPVLAAAAATRSGSGFAWLSGDPSDVEGGGGSELLAVSSSLTRGLATYYLLLGLEGAAVVAASRDAEATVQLTVNDVICYMYPRLERRGCQVRHNAVPSATTGSAHAPFNCTAVAERAGAVRTAVMEAREAEAKTSCLIHVTLLCRLDSPQGFHNDPDFSRSLLQALQRSIDDSAAQLARKQKGADKTAQAKKTVLFGAASRVKAVRTTGVGAGRGVADGSRGAGSGVAGGGTVSTLRSRKQRGARARVIQSIPRWHRVRCTFEDPRAAFAYPALIEKLRSDVAQWDELALSAATVPQERMKRAASRGHVLSVSDDSQPLPRVASSSSPLVEAAVEAFAAAGATSFRRRTAALPAIESSQLSVLTNFSNGSVDIELPKAAMPQTQARAIAAEIQLLKTAAHRAKSGAAFAATSRPAAVWCEVDVLIEGTQRHVRKLDRLRRAQPFPGIGLVEIVQEDTADPVVRNAAQRLQALARGLIVRRTMQSQWAVIQDEQDARARLYAEYDAAVSYLDCNTTDRLIELTVEHEELKRQEWLALEQERFNVIVAMALQFTSKLERARREVVFAAERAQRVIVDEVGERLLVRAVEERQRECLRALATFREGVMWDRFYFEIQEYKGRLTIKNDMFTAHAGGGVKLDAAAAAERRRQQSEIAGPAPPCRDLNRGFSIIQDVIAQNRLAAKKMGLPNADV